eukprot:3025951-Rhodomonas_salina.3
MCDPRPSRAVLDVRAPVAAPYSSPYSLSNARAVYMTHSRADSGLWSSSPAPNFPRGTIRGILRVGSLFAGGGGGPPSGA